MHRKHRLHQSARIATYGMGMAMRAADARQRQQSGNTEHDGHTAHQTIAIVGMSQVLMPVQQPPQLFRISYQQVNARRHRANTLRNHSKGGLGGAFRAKGAASPFRSTAFPDQSMDGTLARPAATTFPIGFKEFVALIASLMALNALAIDAMLPALPAMGDALDIVHENDRQWIIAAYVLGLGAAQLFWGPLADRFGRRRVLLAGVASYVLFSVAAALAGSFAMMIAARVMQGTSAAATRVLAVSIVRDRFAGRAMAKVMSLTFIVFLAVPMLAPTLGQAILLFAPWRWIFVLLALSGLAVLIWVFIRLPETLHPEHRLEISLQRWKVAWLTVVSERMSVGYSLALMLLFGSLMGFRSEEHTSELQSLMRSSY